MEEALNKQIAFFGQLILHGPGLFYWEYDPALRLLSSTCPDEAVVASFLRLSGCQDYLSEYIHSGNRLPMVLSSPIGMSWIAVISEADGQVCGIYVIGPAFTSDVSQRELEQELFSKGFTKETVQAFQLLIARLPITPWVPWLQCGKMLQYSVNGMETAISEFSYQTKAGDSTAQEKASAYASKGSTWLAEQEAMRIIEEGRLDYKQALSRLSRYSAYSAAGDSRATMRKARSSVISFITLSTRAAIRGGLDAEIAYFVGEQYARSAEEAKTMSELMQINDMMFDDFVRRVHRVRTSSGISAPVQCCCDYIELHISEDISLTALAKKVGYTEYYLSRKFKAETGQSISRYIRSCRIKKAQQLLRATYRSVQDIAAEVGFSGSSRFISQFREETGLTPGEYRDKLSAGADEPPVK